MAYPEYPSYHPSFYKQDPGQAFMMGQMRPKRMTYDQWLSATGRGQPMQTQPGKPNMPDIDLNSILKDLGIGGGGSKAAMQTPAVSSSGIFPVGSAEGGTLMSDGTISPMSSMPSALNGAEAPATWMGFSGNGLLNAGPMTTMDYVPGVAGAIGAYDLFSNKRHGGRGAAQGALSGAGIGYTVGGPVGAAAGAVIGGGLGYFGNFGDKDMWQTEQNRLDDLREKGMKIPQGPRLTKGRSKDELIKIEQDKINRGEYGNVKFAQSRNEGDLTPQDIQGYAAVYEKAGDDLQKRLEFADRALKAGAVREHHGTIDIDMSKLNAPSNSPAPEAKKLPTVKVSPDAKEKLFPKIMIKKTGGARS